MNIPQTTFRLRYATATAVSAAIKRTGSGIAPPLSNNGATSPGKTATGVNRSIRSISGGIGFFPISPRNENRIAKVPTARMPMINQISVAE